MHRRPSESSIIHAIYGAAADPAHWPRVLESVADFAGAQGALIAYHHRRGEGDFLISGRLDPDLAEIYVARYANNIWARALAELPARKITNVRSLVAHAALVREEFYHDILRPQHIVDSINWVEPSLSHEGAGGFGFNLNPTQCEHSDRARARLARLAGHLSRALELSASLALHPHTTQFEALVEALPALGFVLDAQAHVQHANAAAVAALQSGNSFCSIGNGEQRLGCRLPEDTAALHRIIGEAAGVATGESAAAPRSVLLGRLPGSQVFAVAAIALPPSAFERLKVGCRSRVLLLAYPKTTASEGTEEPLRRFYHLTPTEARVARLLGSGLSRERVARQLSLSKETIKTHLRRVYAKTSVDSAAQLALIIAALGALPQAHEVRFVD